MDDELKEEDLLKEQDFIPKETWKSPNPFLLGLFFVATAVVIASGTLSWYNEKKTQKFQKPFYNVTNRSFVLFIRQNPSFLKQNVSSNEAYLPGLKLIENVGSNADKADALVQAPDNILFQYHTWKRLLDYPPFKRPIPLDQFKDFLKAYIEWTPDHWKDAPKNYADLVRKINAGAPVGHLEDVLPIEVQKAFTGWKNFTIEKDTMEEFTPTFGLLRDLIKKYPNFQRNYWINLLKDSNPSYLEMISFEKVEPKEDIPLKDLAPFIDIALFNFAMSQTPQEKPVLEAPQSTDL